MKSLARIIIALAVLLGFNSATSWGQEIVSLHHIVQRGETVESLADRYRLSTDMLKAVNLGMDMFHVGQEVLIPVDKKYMFLRSEDESEDILDDIAGYFSELDEASKAFCAHDYKKADKLFKSTIRNHAGYLPCEEAYFGLAMCAYNRHKWKSAINGFTQVISIDECPDDLRERCRGLRDYAEAKREERRQRVANIVGTVLQVAAEVGTAYLAASQANSVGYPSMPQGKSLGSMSNAEFTSYVNTSLVQLANYSVWKVEMQWKQEEYQIKSEYVSMYRMMYGKDPSQEEVQAAYNERMQIKANAYRTAQQASSGMYDRQLGISGSGSTDSEKETTSGYSCSQCRDSHVCQTCNGSGWQDAGLGDLHDHGGGIGKIKCGNCKGSGKCAFCK